MSAEPPPSGGNSGYNPDDWTNANDPVDQQYLAQNYLQFPNAQGAETMGDLIVSGALTAQDPATFADTATFNNGINIGVGDLTFSDLTVQSTAFIEANYAQLNTDNTFLSPYIQKFASGVTFGDDTTQTTAFIEANYAQLNTDNIFLAPYQNTFAGNSSTGHTNAPIKITNGVVTGGVPEYCTMYLDPTSGYDMTLYTNQTTNGGLTVRNRNGASFTLNPITISTGVVGCQTLNPIDMNGKNLIGLENLYTVGNVMNFNDYTGEDLFQLSNGGHISYFNINMNNNNISGASSVSSPLFLVGANGQIGNSATLNPQVMTIRNTALNNTSPQIYFQMNDSTNTTISPMQILWDNVNFVAPIGGISSQVLNVSGTGISVGAVPLKVNNISGNGQSFVGFNADINMNNNNITNVDNLSFASSGSSSTASFQNNVNQNGGTYFVLSTNEGYSIAINGVEKTRYDGTNCQFFSPVILPTGSTAITQPKGTNNTTIATTAFVQSAIPVQRAFSFTETGTSSVMQPTQVFTETIQNGALVQFTNTYFTITIIGFFISAAVLTFDDLPWDTPPPSVSGGQTINGVLQSTLTSYQFYCGWSSTAPWTLTLTPYSGVPTANGSVYGFNLASLGIFNA
jgi:hypothetical protein